MLSRVIVCAGVLLEALIVWRGVWKGMFSKYPFFLTYLACVLAASCTLSVIVLTRPASYPQWYWGTDFLTLFVGCGIVLEIFQHVLSPYPGAERLARISGLLVFGAIFCFAISYQFMKPAGSSAATSFELERNLRTVQSVFLFVVFAIISYYGIALGRNMKGMIYGYGLYVATSLVSLAIRAYAAGPLHAAWDVILQQLSYDVSLVVWTVCLWSYRPNPVSQSPIGLEADYEAFVARVRRTMGSMRTYLTRTERS